jgi:hypothetical protein
LQKKNLSRKKQMNKKYFISLISTLLISFSALANGWVGPRPINLGGTSGSGGVRPTILSNYSDRQGGGSWKFTVSNTAGSCITIRPRHFLIYAGVDGSGVGPRPTIVSMYDTNLLTFAGGSSGGGSGPRPTLKGVDGGAGGGPRPMFLFNDGKHRTVSDRQGGGSWNIAGGTGGGGGGMRPPTFIS